jgi:hypothetical protein
MSQLHSSLNQSVSDQGLSNHTSQNHSAPSRGSFQMASSPNLECSNLETWLKQATRHLSKDSTAQVRAEIHEHYESAREVALSGGASSEEADRSAIVALGDAKTANCQYRNVMLTSAEAKLLREGQWEARAICARPWMKALLLALPAAALWTSAALFINGKTEIARTLLVGGLALLVAFGVPFLPIYTPARARIFRRAKYVLLIAMFALIFGRNVLDWSWLLACSVWPLFWIEWTRTSIRRKIPVARWPKHLYL